MWISTAEKYDSERKYLHKYYLFNIYICYILYDRLRHDTVAINNNFSIPRRYGDSDVSDDDTGVLDELSTSGICRTTYCIQ